MRQPLGSEGTIDELECSRFNLAQLGSVATSASIDVTIRWVWSRSAAQISKRS